MPYPETEELFRLAEEDPPAFEAKSREMIKDLIAKSGNRRRLEGIQWRIDQERRLFKGSPADFASYIFGKMWDSFLELDGRLKSFRNKF